MAIEVKDLYQLKLMRKAGLVVADTLKLLKQSAQIGMTTLELDEIAANNLAKHGATSSFLGYHGFPAVICASVNEEVVHGIPNKRKLVSGDVLSIDFGAIVDGWHGDTSRMFWIGNKVSIKAKRLTQITYEATMKGIETVKPGSSLWDIGNAIQTYAEKHGYSVVRDYCGHGLGKIFHTTPNVVHYREDKNKKIILEEGMFFTVEPMINIGKYDTILSTADGWTVTTRDKSLSAQFEHSIGVTSDGFEIFTASPKGYTMPEYK